MRCVGCTRWWRSASTPARPRQRTFTGCGSGFRREDALDTILACVILVVAIVSPILNPTRLLEQARQGDASAFAELVTPHVAGWIGAARRVVGADAEDVVNRVLEKLWVAVRRD